MTVQEEAEAYKKFRNEEALEYCRKQAMLGQMVASENWKHYNTATKALEEVEQYRALGTVEELKEAREKQVAKKPIHDDGVWSICPCCGEKVANDSYEAVNGELSYCEKCGKAIDWSEEDD